jgi:CheY-like chemotaxis protein
MIQDNWSRFSVLIVEDDDKMRETLCDAITRLGVQIFSAENGEKAFHLIESHKIHFVLSDVQMPVMTGVELLRKVKEKNPTIPIFLLATGQAQLTEKEALAFGAIGLLHKPFHLRALIEKIKEALLNVEKLMPS